MTKFRKSAAIVTAILLAAGVLAGLLAFLHPKKAVSARAITEIDGATDSTYLEISDREIRGFRSGVTLPHNVSLSVPEGYTIRANAFEACNQLVSVTLPAGIEENDIGADAFKECRRLVEIRNLSALDLEGATASQQFGGIARYALNVYGADGASQMTTENGYLFITDTVHTGNNAYLLGADTLTDGAVILPAFSKEYAVYDYAFHSRADVISVSASAGAEISAIGRLAFFECRNLETVDFSAADVKSIGYSAFTRCGKLESLTLSDGLLRIEGSAFAGCSSLSGTLTVPGAVSEIGMDAFRGCSSLNEIVFEEGAAELVLSSGVFAGCSSLTVTELPARFKEMGVNTFTDCAALSTVYFNSEVNFAANVIPDEANVYFGANTLVIFDTPAHYQAATANSSNAAVHQSMMTYLVTLNFSEVTGTATAPAPIKLLRLKNRAFNFTQNADKSWSTTADNAEGLIPVQNGYSVSKWYRDAQFGGAAMTARTLTEALADTEEGTVPFYAKRIAKPTVTAKTNLVYEAGKTYSVSNTADFLSEAVTDSDLALQIKKESAVQESGVTDAGTYSFTAKIKDAKFGAWENDFTLDFTIARKPVAIAGEIKWQSDSGLIDGTLYVYQKGDGTFEYSSTVISDPAAQGLTYYSALTLTNSVARHTGAALTVSLEQSEYFTIGAYTNATAANAGKYTSSVQITANPNYLLRNFGDSESVTNESRGVTVEIDTDRTTATVYKVWYIVQIGNRLVSDAASDAQYAIADWTYGAGSAVAAPVLRYGQDTAGANVTFTVTRNGNAVGGSFALARFADVVNATMPAGVYVLTFSIPAYDVYPATSDTVTFAVTPAQFREEWKEAITASFTDDNKRFDGSLQLYRTEDLTGWDGNVPAAAPEGVWANETECYSQQFTLTYNFAGAQNRTYYTFGEVNGLGEANYLPKQPGTYTVYYNFTAENYEPLVNEASAERTDYGFTFTVFRVIAAPTVAELTYTGSRMLPLVTEGEPNTSNLYEITYDRTEGSYVNAGDTHRVTVTLTDGTHYKWANGSGYAVSAAKEILFTIRRAENADSLALSIPQWTYGNFEKELHRPIWSTVFSDDSDENFYTFTLTSASDPAQVYEYDAQDGFKYVPIGTYTLTATAKGYAEGDASTAGYNWNRLVRQGTVIITKGANSWAVTPNVMQWEFGGYVKDVNLILAQPNIRDEQNPVVFKITYDAAGKNAVEGLEDFRADANGIVSDEVAAALAGLRASSYYLWSSVAPTEQYTGIEAKTGFEFKVTRSENYWDEAPAVSSWVTGSYSDQDNVITAKPHFGGTVRYIIVLAGDGENVIYDSANGINRLAEAGAGVYELRASVAGTDDYADLAYSLTFRIFEKAGLAWWAILLIVVGSLCVVALIFFILHQKGVLQIITGKVVLAMRTRATVDATIAAVRANKVAEDAKKSVADAEAAEAAEARRRAIEEAKSRPLDERAEVLEELAREESERADKIQKHADTMYQTAEKMRARAAKTRKHLEETVEDSFDEPELPEDGNGEE